MPAGLAFLLAFGSPEEGAQRWCAFGTAAQVRKAAGDGTGLTGEAAEIAWAGDQVTRLVVTTQSQDALVVDTYVFNRAGEVLKLTRRGNYVNDQPVTAQFVRLDWPRHTHLNTMPFGGLILRGTGTLTVRSGCTKPGP